MEVNKCNYVGCVTPTTNLGEVKTLASKFGIENALICKVCDDCRNCYATKFCPRCLLMAETSVRNHCYRDL